MKPETNRLSTLARSTREHLSSIEQDTNDIEAYVVGGAVRDALMGRGAYDLDWVVVGESVESMLDRGFEGIEATSFPVFHDSDHEEWALARTESKVGEGYHGFEIETENVSLRDDLKRRDLTINAMALDPSAEPVESNRSIHEPGEYTLIDPHNGMRDIEKEQLHPAGLRFKEDPVRVLRLARYAARFPSFRTTGYAMEYAGQVAHELNRMSRDRIGVEIEKAMEQARSPRRFWEVLRDCGALAVIWSELDRATVVLAGHDRHHHESDLFEHSMMVLDKMFEICEEQGIERHDRVRRLLMAVSHDIGKVVVADRKGGVLSDDPPMGFAGHAEIGAGVMLDVARRLGLSTELKNVMADGSSCHMEFHDMPEWEPNKLTEFVEDRTPSPDAKRPHFATVEELLDLAQADHEGRITLEAESLEAEEVSPVEPMFDRNPYERAIEIARRAIDDVDGYSVMRSELCDLHRDTTDDEDINGVMSSCPDCRTPGPWIGERIESRRYKLVREEMEGET